ncbi:MAG: branched-chain amino acid ABC transporter permease [Deltaproteobacteria bacterium]|nr:branched-chain amino acid ABC transporter permease [Deltaproteobacteria bacterium]
MSNNKNWLKLPSFWLLLASMIVLMILPTFTSSRFVLNMVATITIAASFTVSYNLLAGFTGVFSLGHAVFFGSGAYAVGIILSKFGSTPLFFLVAVVVAIILAVILGLCVGYLALRLKAVYYAMITFAVAELFVITAEKSRDLTGGLDGLGFQLPEILSGRYTGYYIAIVLFFLTVFFMYRLLNSPTGKILVAIRENEVRVSALGFDVFRYKLLSNVIAGLLAASAGIAYAILNQFVVPSILGIGQTVNALLMTIVGGMGTLAGPIIGAAVVTLFGDWLASLAKIHPLFERWPIIFGLLYILIILTMPGGIMSGYYRIKSKFFRSN